MNLLRLPLFLILAVLLTGCEQKKRANVNYEMGERVEMGPFAYVVVESGWRSQIGEGFQVNTPKNRFLVLSLTVTNGGTSETSVPMLALEGPGGRIYPEVTDGAGVQNWLGVLRTLGPAQTLQGRVVFDVPLGSYRLRLPDGAESGYERYAWVTIPLRMDIDSVETPLPASSIK